MFAPTKLATLSPSRSTPHMVRAGLFLLEVVKAWTPIQLWAANRERLKNRSKRVREKNFFMASSIMCVGTYLIEETCAVLLQGGVEERKTTVMFWVSLYKGMLQY